MPSSNSQSRIGVVSSASSVFRSRSPAKLSDVMIPDMRRGISRKKGNPMILIGRMATF